MYVPVAPVESPKRGALRIPIPQGSAAGHRYEDLPVVMQEGERYYKCIFCGRLFKKRDYLKAHLRIHTGEKPYLCAFCPYRAKQKSHLNTHMLRHLNTPSVGNLQ